MSLSNEPKELKSRIGCFSVISYHFHYDIVLSETRAVERYMVVKEPYDVGGDTLSLRVGTPKRHHQ